MTEVQVGNKGWEKAWNYWTISTKDSATLTHTPLNDWDQQKQASIFLKQYWSIYLQLMNAPTRSISKGQGREIHYQNTPPRTAEEGMVKSFWNWPPFMKPGEKMSILIQKGTCKSAMPNSCPRFEWGNAMLQGILKKIRKQNVKKGLKKPQHNRAVIWQAHTRQRCCDVGGHGNRTPRLVHATRREGKKRQAATRATRTVSHERRDRWWNQHGCTLEKLWAV